MTTSAQYPYHPIIYVRGFAACKARSKRPLPILIGVSILARPNVKRFYFESPLVRLMGDHKYEDVFVDSDDLVDAVKTAVRTS